MVTYTQINKYDNVSEQQIRIAVFSIDVKHHSLKFSTKRLRGGSVHAVQA